MISVGFSRALGVLLFLGGCVLVGLNAYATWLQGGTWAVTADGKFIAKWTAITIEIVGVVLVGFAAGSAWSAKQRLVGFGLGLVMIVSGAMVVNSIASFRATERMSASKTREAAIDRVAEADKLAKDNVKKMADLAAKNADDKGARRDFIGANAEAIKAFRDAPVEVKVAPDAGAELWATAFGLTLHRVQMIQSALDAVWQVVLSMVCFPAAGFFMNPFGWLKSATDRKPAGSSDNSGGKKDNVVPLHKPETTTTAVSASALSEAQPSTPPAHKAALTGSEQTTQAKVSSGTAPVELHAPRQQRWTEDEVDAFLTRAAKNPRRPTWRAMGLMMGWDHAQVYRRWQKLEGDNNAGRRALGSQHRVQHRQQEHRSTYPN